MAQYARPDSDIQQTNWSGGYTTIDDETFNDTDYITGAKDANGTAIYGLSNVDDPGVGTGHTVRFRSWQQNNDNQRTLAIDLYQGSTKISGLAAFNVTKGYAVSGAWTLTSTEADNITDYTDLRIWFTSGGDIGAPARDRNEVYVTWAELEVPDASTGYDLTASSGSFSLSGQTTAFKASRKLLSETVSYNLTGISAGLKRSFVLQASRGEFSIAGQTITFDVSRLLLSETISYNITGQSASLLQSKLIAINNGQFTLTGVDASLQFIPVAAPDYTLTCQTVSFSLTGLSLGILASRLLSAIYGDFTLVGSSSSFVRQFVFGVSTGNFSLSGSTANIILSRYLTAVSATYTLTPSLVTLAKRFILATEYADFQLSYQTADLLLRRILSVSQGDYNLTGIAALLVYITQTTPYNREYIVPQDLRTFEIANPLNE